MTIYIITFLICEFFAISLTHFNNKKNCLKIPFLLIIIVLLSIIGGLRNLEIGTDVLVYGDRWFKLATVSNNFGLYKSLLNTTDIGYVFLNYIVSRITSNTNVFLFVHQLICNCIIITVLYKNEKKCRFSISLLCYLCLFYLRTYNILRQAVALSLVFYATSNLLKNKDKKFIIYVVISSLFHFTAIFSLLMYPIKKICYSNNRKKSIYIFAILATAVLATINIESVIRILYSHGIVNKRIYDYLFNFINENGKLLNVELLIKTALLLPILIKYKELKNENNKNYFLIVLVIIEFILFQLRNKIMYADRISLYFGYSIMLLLPQVINMEKNNKKKLLYIILIASLLILYCYYKYIYSGSCEIYPYKFYWNY